MAPVGFYGRGFDSKSATQANMSIIERSLPGIASDCGVWSIVTFRLE